jgi:hypothetical protein
MGWKKLNDDGKENLEKTVRSDICKWLLGENE